MRFFLGQTLEIARNLIGATIVTHEGGVMTGGLILETEAYLAEGDPASHSAKGETSRNEVMFWRGGHGYVYFIYGKHYCMNVVTEPAGIGAAVLIRAILPMWGEEMMRHRRRTQDPRRLTDGPGKVCQALERVTK